LRALHTARRAVDIFEMARWARHARPSVRARVAEIASTVLHHRACLGRHGIGGARQARAAIGGGVAIRAAAVAGVCGPASRRQVLAGLALGALMAPICRLVLPCLAHHADPSVRACVADIALTLRRVPAPGSCKRLRGARHARAAAYRAHRCRVRALCTLSARFRPIPCFVLAPIARPARPSVGAGVARDTPAHLHVGASGRRCGVCRARHAAVG
jgi:hypothetical protein